MLQTALGVAADGIVGAQTLNLAGEREKENPKTGDPRAFLMALHEARQSLMRDHAGTQQTSKVLQARHEKRMRDALEFSLKLLAAGTSAAKAAFCRSKLRGCAAKPVTR